MYCHSINSGVLLCLEAPGNHVDGGWEGDIRAIKWQDQEGTVHSGCKGKMDISTVSTKMHPVVPTYVLRQRKLIPW